MTGNRSNDVGEGFTEEDYRNFELKLFSDSTPPPELKNICITLAHLPTIHAQELLNRFMKSDRADEVECLDLASDETQLPSIFQQEKQIKKYHLTQKVMGEIQVEITVLKKRLEDRQKDLAKKEIECEAIRELVQKGEVEANAELELLDRIAALETAIEGFRKQIILKEKIFHQIKQSIKN